MNKRILLSTLLMFIGLPGCAVIPVLQDEPFKDETVTELEPGQVNRADVLMALGEPAKVYDREKVFLYTENQVHAVWFMVIGAGYNAGMIGGGFTTRHFLVFEFDEHGRVAQRTAIPYGAQNFVGATDFRNGGIVPISSPKGSACLPSGLCVADALGDKVFANPERDAEAKIFRRSSNCTVYAYRDNPGLKPITSVAPIFGYHLKFDHQFAGMLIPNGYHRFEVAPGYHEITVNSRIAFSTMPVLKRVRFRCKAGDVRYLRFRIPPHSIWTGKFETPFEAGIVEAEQGRAAILEKHLLLNPKVDGGTAM